MNPRQRRGVLLLFATALGAVAVFIAVSVYVGEVNSKVGSYAPVLELTADVTELQPITADMVTVSQLPERWAPESALTSVDQVVGMVASGNYTAGSSLQEGMVAAPPGLQPGYREVAILVDAETGVAGKVAPGDRVDIIATTRGSDEATQRSEIWVENALVLEVGVTTTVEGADATGNFQTGTGVPVTFALPVDQALRLAYVESFSTKLRLALRGRGDEASLPGEQLFFEQEAGL